MNVMTMPPKTQTADPEKESTQTKAALGRFWLQVDGQTKSSYADQAAAEKAGKEIKVKSSVVRVSIYDTEKGETKIV